MSTSLPPQKIRTVFMGTPEFSLPGLEALLESPDFEVIGVVTQEDKAVGRKQIISQPPVKKLASACGLPVWQPRKIRDLLPTLSGLSPDLIVVIAYGKILPRAILDLPRFGCVNVHASLLPRYRGASCLNAPLLNGDEETGVTIMLMDEGLDTGPILAQTKLPLAGNETLPWLHDRLARLGAEQLVPALQSYLSGRTTPQPQSESGASYVRTLRKEDGLIDWHRPAREIERQIRAYSPWPGTYTKVDDKKLKIIRAALFPGQLKEGEIGELLNKNGQLAVRCGQGAILILELQLEGKKALSVPEFISGYSRLIGQKLG